MNSEFDEFDIHGKLRGRGVDCGCGRDASGGAEQGHWSECGTGMDSGTSSG